MIEIAAFRIEEALLGQGLPSFADGKLVVGDIAAGDETLREMRARIVAPGEAVRIENALDVVLPTCDAADPGVSFPGVVGPHGAAVGERLNRLEGLVVVPVCDWLAAGYAQAEEFPGSYIDRDGPGAALDPWRSESMLVLEFIPVPGTPAGEADASIRKVTLGVARDLAATTLGKQADRVEVFGPTPAGALPRVCAILQAGSEGPLLDTYLRGRPLLDQAPLVLPIEDLFGGAVTAGAYDWAGMRNPTACYQSSALIRELLARDGRELSFAGAILTLGYLDGAEAKREMAAHNVELAVSLRAQAAVCTTFESGNSHTDTMLTVQALERAGVRTVALVAETNGGLTDHVPEADCLVSTGNEDESVAAWTPDETIGGAAPLGPIPAALHLGALTQMGDARLQAVPA